MIFRICCPTVTAFNYSVFLYIILPISERLGKLKNEEHGIYDAEFERSHAVLRLTYWKADSSFITEAKENGTGTLLKRDSTVR